MTNFPEYIRQRLESNGYGFIKKFANLDLFMRSPDDKPIWICYLEVEIDPEQIRRMFDFDGYVLIVVNEKLIPDEIISRQETPFWLRILHGLYMGRIYVWNDRYLFGLHFDYDTGDISESGIIQPDDLLLVETGTWLRGWTGIYKLARFYDRQWWNEDTWRGQKQSYDNPYAKQEQSSSRQSYEQARDSYWEQQKARERAKRTQYDSSGYAYDPNEWENGKPPKPPPFNQDKAKRDFMREFAQAGSPSAVKALYRELAKTFHPDLNPGIDTTEVMQQINAAYDRYR